MKKNEPLKGKMMTIPIFIETNVYRDEEIFKFEDVKSAVEGLISDLEAERVGIFPSIDDDDYNIFYADDGEFVRFEKVIELIKKWFPDMFENEK